MGGKLKELTISGETLHVPEQVSQEELATAMSLAKRVAYYFNLLGGKYSAALDDYYGLSLTRHNAVQYYEERDLLEGDLKFFGKGLNYQIKNAMSWRLPRGYDLTLSLPYSPPITLKLLYPPLAKISAPSSTEYFLDLTNPKELKIVYEEEIPRPVVLLGESLGSKILRVFGDRFGTKTVPRYVVVPLSAE